MKKYLFILAAAALGFASCSNDDVVAENTGLNDANTISFRSFVQGATRATDITAGTLASFTAFATEGSDFSKIYFNETTFNNSSGTYTSVTKYYWPSTGTLDFYAYAYNGADGQVTHTAQTKAFTVTPDAAAANQTDLVFANTNGKSKTGTYGTGGTNQYGKDGVPLNFRHAESKITVQLKNSSTALKVTVKDVAIGYLNTTGTYTYSGSTSNTNTDGENNDQLKFADWTAKSGTGSYTQTATTTSYTSATATTALPTSFILIPQALTTATAYSAASADAAFNGAFITVQLKIQNAENDAYIVGGDGDNYVTALWPLPAGTWYPGYHYTYTLDLAGGGYYPTNQTSIGSGTALDPILDGAEIKFVSVTVDAWADGSNTDVNNNPS